MSVATDKHPEYSELLALMDRDLPQDGDAVSQHVLECGWCRRQIEECRAALRDYAQFEEAIVLPAVPPEPHPWLDLRGAVQQRDSPPPRHTAVREERRVTAWLADRASRLTAAGTALGCLAFAIVLAIRFEQEPREGVQRPRDTVAPPSAPAIPTSPHAQLDSRPQAPAVAPPVMVESALNTEVRVFAALHRLGADLGEPIEVATGTDGRIVVGGAGVAPERQAEIREALAGESRVAVEFADAARKATPGELRTFAINHGAFEARLRDFSGGQAAYERFANHLLDESEETLARAHALAALARRFPAERQSELREEERRILVQMTATHSTRFRQHAAALLRLVAPLSQALGASQPIAVASADPLDAAKRMDRALSALLGGTQTDLTPDRVLAELSNASAALTAAIGGGR